MRQRTRSYHRRWFIYTSTGLFIFLCLAIIFAAFLLLRRGRLPRTGLITGSSMEPVFRGPRYLWSCTLCKESQEFALDTCKSNQPFRCQFCRKIDFESAVDFNDVESIHNRIRQGDQVRFATLRTIRANRAHEIANGLVHESGLQRGDVVVFQESREAKREIKRIVGFAFEQITVKGGDLFVNQERWHKTLEQSLRQSILLHAWERAISTKRHESPQPSGRWKIGGDEFQGVLNSKTSETMAHGAMKLRFENDLHEDINNQLAVNAHDSHAIVSVPDFGIALQLSRLESPWKIKCIFHSWLSRPVVLLELLGSSLTIESGGQVARVDLFQRQDKSVWIVMAMVDGHLLIGSQDEEWLRAKLPLIPANLPLSESHESTPIEVNSISGSLEIDQLLVFRDIYYRGNGDSDVQTWSAGERIVVLGDNVSASSDSRERWPDGLPPNSAKGVVLQTESPIEVLLRQR